MADEQFKRNIAFKIKIGDLLVGKPIMDGERFSFLELGNKKIIRVNIIGNITDKFINDSDEKKFGSLTIDDGSGQIKLKFFGDDLLKFKDVSQGQTVLVIGVLRYWNNEIYVSPEIIREQDTKYLMVRKLETENKHSEEEKDSDPEGRGQMAAVKDKILGAIKDAEEDGGVEVDKIILGLKEISPVIINQEIQKFLEEGIIFEPRPGKVRYLG